LSEDLNKVIIRSDITLCSFDFKNMYGHAQLFVTKIACHDVVYPSLWY